MNSTNDYKEVDDSVANHLKNKSDKNEKKIKSKAIFIEPSPAYIFAGFCSFLLLGLGQLLLDRKTGAASLFVGAIIYWFMIIRFSFDVSSLFVMAFVVLLSIIPNVIAAYLAANGHKNS